MGDVMDEVKRAQQEMNKKKEDKPGKDTYATLSVSLEEAVLGAKKPVKYERGVECKSCKGTGRIPSTFIDCDCDNGFQLMARDIDVTVPPGVGEGSTLRIKDQGGDGQPPGSLYVTIKAPAMNAGASITRRGADLYSDVVVRFPKKGEASSVRVRTVDGTWGNLSVAADADKGKALRIKGKGAPVKPGSDECGDHYFTIKDVIYESE